MSRSTTLGARSPTPRRRPESRGPGDTRQPVPVIDLFSGCGGFSEGFLASGHYKLAVAVDQDDWAHRTHRLRALFHAFPEVPDSFYEALQAAPSLQEFEAAFPEQAELAASQVMQLELGKDEITDQKLRKLLHERLDGHDHWVLIGGPPCQAYSIVGRVRNKAVPGYRAEADRRHYLYQEYLKVIATHWPSVFVMENVPGMLNARVGGERVWEKLLEDLVDPAAAVGDQSARDYDGYRLYSLVEPCRGNSIFGVPTLAPDEYVVRCERYGIPQARHRVFILGVRSDVEVSPAQLRPHGADVPVGSVLEGLPALRGGLSRIADTDRNWKQLMLDALEADWFAEVADLSARTHAHIRRTLRTLKVPAAGRGADFVDGPPGLDAAPAHLQSWLHDPRLPGALNHETKAHMEADIHRYLFAAAYTEVHGDALRLAHFPQALLPQHENVRSGERSLHHSNFADRFTVQLRGMPARTIVSHIAKDGHYYIHPDPRQARSLTVREAARVQTFPDNFLFCGPRTSQYSQVGNAVPPYLASQIADVVTGILGEAASSRERPRAKSVKTVS